MDFPLKINIIYTVIKYKWKQKSKITGKVAIDIGTIIKIIKINTNWSILSIYIKFYTALILKIYTIFFLHNIVNNSRKIYWRLNYKRY